MVEVSYIADLHTKTGLRPSRQTIKRAALAFAVALGIGATGDFGYGYLTTGQYLETTNDAYVKANSTIITPKISGYIAKVLVADNQQVKAGQFLARIDDRDFQDRAESGQRRRGGIASGGTQPRCPDRAATAADRARHRRRRCRRSQFAVRARGAGPLRRLDEVGLRHGATRPAE